jgi:LPXTG-motif cell wall-anchored protein/uncharacterized repeat protein (TIGR01451 family)
VVNGGDNQVTLASGDSADVPYSCSFAGDPNATGGSNVAHITWNDGASSTTASSPVTFAMTYEVNKTVSVYDDKVSTPGGILLGTATWDQPETFHYSLPLTAPSTECAAFVNHAWVTGDDQSKLDQAMATATICPNPGTWTVDKSSTPGDGASVPTGSDVVYHVHATKTGGVDPTDVVVVDDMSDVAPYITGAPTFTAPAGTTASYDSSTHLLTWTIDTLSGTDTLDVTVHIAPDAYDVDLHNVVTSRGSSNCPDEETAADVPACSTDHLTPAYTLEKSSSVLEGGTVMPPYRGADGDTITYTLTVRNTSDAVINETTLPGAAVTDDLSDVLDNATFNSGSITPSGGTADLAGTTLTWHLPTIQPGGTATLTYTVTVKTGSSAATTWDQVLHNQAAPGDGGTCVVSEFSQDELCDTTAVTPPVTTLQVEKVDAETGAPLDGATFALYLDNAPTDAAQVGPEDTALGTASTGPDGIAQFPELLPGSYLVKETTAPTGYDLPANDTMQVVIGENNFVAGGLMTPIEFRDPAQGQIGITKAQYELDTSGNWVPSDGVVDYGDTVKYVLQVDSTGPKLFHDVTLTDYVPGYNPADVTSTAKATLVPGSAVCTGSLTCTVTTDATTGLVTWSAGTLSTDSGTAEMVVTFPQLPSPVPFDATGTYTTTIWNVGYLDWNEVTGPESAPVGHHLTSNEVTEQATTTQVVTPPVVTPPVVTPPVVSPPHAAPPPPATTLPNTGGPQGWYLPVGLGLVLMGTGLVLGERRRRRV